MPKNFNKLSLPKYACNQGFTLVELSLVLTVMAVIIAATIALLTTAMKNQQTNRLSQQIITLVENTRSYTRRVDASTINFNTSDLCNLGLLPQDISNATQAGSCPNIETYMDALNQPVIACAAGGTYTTRCGISGLSSMIAVAPQNLATSDCTSLISKLASGTSDLGFMQYVINGNTFSTSNANNLGPAVLAGTSACAASNPVNVELDFSL